VILFGGIFSSSLMGWWQTESTKEAALFTEGEFAGQANPADIRGSYTFGDVEKNFAVPAGSLAQAFEIETADPAAFQVKELETLYADSPVEIGTASVRLFVAFYLGLPFDLSTDVYLPQSAADILGTRSLNTEQLTYLTSHIADATQNAPGVDQTSHTPAVEGSETMIRGKTTFADLLNLGLSPETIEDILKMPLPDDTNMKIKDFCSANGLDFETIKLALQEAAGGR
jgi:hypothetical protein